MVQKEYPACLIQSSLHDPRVPAWGTLKFVQKLRDLAQEPTAFPDFHSKNIVCRLINEEGAGHFGSLENDTNLGSLAYEFAWLDFLMFGNKSN